MSSPRAPQGVGEGLAVWSAAPWLHSGRDSAPRGKKIKKRKKIPIPSSYLPFFADSKCLMGEMGNKDLGSREGDRGLVKEGNAAKNLCLQAAGRDKLRPEDDTSFSVISW